MPVCVSVCDYSERNGVCTMGSKHSQEEVPRGLHRLPARSSAAFYNAMRQ